MHQCFVVHGAGLCSAALDANLTPRELFVESDVSLQSDDVAALVRRVGKIPIHTVNAQLLDQATDTKNVNVYKKVNLF